MAWRYPLLHQFAAPRTAPRGPTLDAALAAAWDTAGSRGRAQITELQLSRSGPDTARQLVAHLHHLDEAARRVLLQRAADLHAALRHALGRTPAANVQTPINALWIIEHADAATLAYLAVPALRHPDPAVSRAAEHCLCRLATGESPAARDRPPRAAAALGQALQEAVAAFTPNAHPGALRAWLALGPAAFDAGGPALAALQNPEHPAVTGLRALAREAASSEVRRGLVGLLGLPPVALTAVAGLSVALDQGPTAFVQALRGQSALLDLPAIRHGLARAADPARLWPDRASDSTWDTCDALPAWAQAIGGSPAEILARLGPLCTLGPRPRRLDALRRLIDLTVRSPAAALLRQTARSELTPLAADPDPALAAVAGTALLQLDTRQRVARRRPVPTASLTMPPAPSPSPGPSPGPGPGPGPDTFTVAHCRRTATRRLAATAFDPLWHGWSRVPAHQRRRAITAALRLDPTARTRLRTALASNDPDVRRHAQTIRQALAPAGSTP